MVYDYHTHTTILGGEETQDWKSIVGWFTQEITQQTRLFSKGDMLYPLMRDFIEQRLFEKKVSLEEINVLRNLAEESTTKVVLDVFKKAINAAIVKDRGATKITEWKKHQ